MFLSHSIDVCIHIWLFVDIFRGLSAILCILSALHKPKKTCLHASQTFSFKLTSCLSLSSPISLSDSLSSSLSSWSVCLLRQRPKSWDVSQQCYTNSKLTTTPVAQPRERGTNLVLCRNTRTGTTHSVHQGEWNSEEGGAGGSDQRLNGTSTALAVQRRVLLEC